MRAQLDDALRQYRSMAAGLTTLTERLAALRATGRASDGSVHATVDARGALVELTIDPVVGARLDPKALSFRVLEASHRAGAELRDQVTAAVTAVLPESVRAAVGVDGTVDLGRLLPSDVEFDASLRSAGSGAGR